MIDEFAALRSVCARKPHGVRARYVSGCRCLPCRAAAARYESGRLAARRDGDWNGIVAAEPVRRHLLELSRQGVGYESVASASDIRAATLLGIKLGRQLQCRARTARKVLAVDASARGDRSLVPAGRTWRILDKLLNAGYSAAQLARWLGYRTPALQFHRQEITARNALRVERLYRLIDAGRLRRP